MKYYVYLFMRENYYSPYYVGKGSGKRCYEEGGRQVKRPKDKDRIRKVFHTDSEKEALAVERTLIKFYGRKVDGGILHNISEGGNQPPSHKGVKKTEAHKKLIGEASKRNNTIKHFHTPEARAKRVASQTGKRQRGTQVRFRGEFYKSVSLASEAHKCSRHTVYRYAERV